MIEVVIEDAIEKPFRAFLSRLEHIGFFLATWSEDDQRFVAREWRAIEGSEYESLNDFHVSLSDATKTEIIRWAWQSRCSLIETHSHGEYGVARFSPSDLAGFETWIPHLWWRLAGRPYAALVTTGETIDGLAWTVDPQQAQQVEYVSIGRERLETTHRTLTT